MPTGRLYPLILTYLIWGSFLGCDASIFPRLRRTVPFDFSTLRSLLANGGIWSLPRKTVNTAVKLFSSPMPKNPVPLNIRPDDGIRASYAYQQRYGYRGERLIAAVGAGFPPDSNPRLPPLPAIGLTPPLPTF